MSSVTMVLSGPLYVCTVNQMLGRHYEGYPVPSHKVSILAKHLAVAPVKTRSYGAKSFIHTPAQHRFHGWLNHLPMQGTGIQNLFLLQNEVSAGLEFSTQIEYYHDEVIPGARKGSLLLNADYGMFADGFRFFRIRRQQSLPLLQQAYLDFVVIVFPRDRTESDERVLFSAAHTWLQNIAFGAYSPLAPFPIPEMHIRVFSSFPDLVGAQIPTSIGEFRFQEVYQGMELSLNKKRQEGLRLNGFSLIIGSEYHRQVFSAIPSIAEVQLGVSNQPQMQVLLAVTEKDSYITTGGHADTSLPAVFQIANFTEVHAILNVFS